MAKAKGMWTSQLAEAGGVTSATVLFYERLGLLPEPPRKRSGYRMYRPDALVVLRFIVNAKGLGFMLEEIKPLLALRDEAAECAAVHPLLDAKREALDAKLGELTAARRTLAEAIEGTSSDAPAAEHPLFRSRY